MILNGALAEGVKLPAVVTLRLPASSGGAAAVAFSDTANGNLLNLNADGVAGAIALLAFALARPSLQMGGSLGSQEAPVAAALVFDTAPRMDYKSENQTRLDAARTQKAGRVNCNA